MGKLGLLIALYLSVFAVYWQVKGHQFILVDDHVHITENPRFQPVSLANLKALWTKPHEGLYIPVTYTLWGGLVKLNERFYGSLKPVTFHLVNLFLHIANTWLVFANLLLLAFSPIAAFIGALFFALHLAQVESVAWISGFKDLLSTFFGLLSLWSFVSFSQNLKKSRYRLATALFILALLSKPSAVALVLIVLGIELGLRHQSFKLTARRLVPWVLLTLAAAIHRRRCGGVLFRQGLGPFVFRCRLLANTPASVGSSLGLRGVDGLSHRFSPAT